MTDRDRDRETLEKYIRMHEAHKVGLEYVEAIRSLLEENERMKAYLSQWSAGRTGERTMTALDLLEENERLRDDLKSTSESLETWQTEASALHGRIEAALALHKPKGLKIVPGPQYCAVCGTAHPCPTIKALKGEEE